MGNPQSGARNLGAFVVNYSHRKRLVRNLVMVGVGVVCFAAATWVSYNMRASSSTGGCIFFLYAVGVIVGLIGLFGLPLSLIAATNRVKIYENGFTYKTLFKSDSVLWKDITKTAYGLRVAENVDRGGGLIGSALGAMMKQDRKLTIYYGQNKWITFDSGSLPWVDDLYYRATRREGKL